MPVKILVVDDEPDLHLLIRQKYKRRTTDWTFAFADDGVEALEQIESDPEIELVLTDINMPRMDGLTLLARLAEIDRPLRVVIVSAYGDMKNIRAAMNRGAYDFVTKPINLDDLEATIAKTWQEVEAQKKALDAQHQLESVRNALAVSQEVQTLKTRFFANLSHEFRTPLTLILGPLQDALHGAAGPLPAEQVAVMHRHALRLKHLIDQLLDLSKLEAGRMTLRAARHDVLPLLRDLVLSFAPAAERKQVALRFLAPEEDEILLYYEPDKLEKIVANLLSNAIKFTPEHGAIRVSVASFEDTHVDLVVRDNGPGIPAGELPHLFDRFHRVEAPGVRHQPGTGIGLSLAKELVALHGGELFVESEEGFGATFTVRLPRGKGHLAPEDLADEVLVEEETVDERVDVWTYERVDDVGDEDDGLPEDTSKRPDVHTSIPQPTVLIVEDNPDVRAYVKRHLAARYHVVEAADGVEGLAQARAAPPDLVVSDVMMPNMDGFDLARALKADAALNHIPVILLTAKASEESKLEGLETGADDYLHKPFNARELLLRVENLIEVRRLLRQRFSGEVVLKPTDIAVPSAAAALLERAQAFVEAHMGDRDFEVAKVADEVGMSPRQFRRKIREITGLSPAAFVRTLRLQRAAQLLEKKAGGVSEVAYEVGFQDAKYFSRLFRQIYGVLPSDYGRSSGQSG